MAISKPKNKGGRPPKVDIKRFKEVVEEYLKDCETNRKTPFLVELAYLLGVSDDTITNYRQKPGYSELIKRVDRAGEIALFRKVSDENKPVGGIFLLKAKYGYIEQQKLDVTTNGESIGVVQLPQRSA